MGFVLQLICATNGGGVMHATDSHSEDNSTEHTLPQHADPSFLKVEKEHQSDNAVSDSDNTGRNDEACRIHERVV